MVHLFLGHFIRYSIRCGCFFDVGVVDAAVILHTEGEEGEEERKERKTKTQNIQKKRLCPSNAPPF